MYWLIKLYCDSRGFLKNENVCDDSERSPERSEGKIKRYDINILLPDVGRVAPAGVTRTQVCYPPTYQMDPKWCITPFFICTLNGVTPAKHFWEHVFVVPGLARKLAAQIFLK